MEILNQPAFVSIDAKTLYITTSESFLHDAGEGVSVHVELFGAKTVPTIRLHADAPSADPTSRGEPLDVAATEEQVLAWAERLDSAAAIGLKPLLLELAATTDLPSLERLGRAFFAKLTPSMLLALTATTSFVHDVVFPIELALSGLAEREAA
jgi:hypothetical protein